MGWMKAVHLLVRGAGPGSGGFVSVQIGARWPALPASCNAKPAAAWAVHPVQDVGIGKLG